MMDHEEYRRYRMRQEMGEEAYQAMLKKRDEEAQQKKEDERLFELGLRRKRTDIKPVVWPKSPSRSERKRKAR